MGLSRSGQSPGVDQKVGELLDYGLLVKGGLTFRPEAVNGGLQSLLGELLAAQPLHFLPGRVENEAGRLSIPAFMPQPAVWGRRS